MRHLVVVNAFQARWSSSFQRVLDGGLSEPGGGLRAGAPDGERVANGGERAGQVLAVCGDGLRDGAEALPRARPGAACVPDPTEFHPQYWGHH